MSKYTFGPEADDTFMLRALQLARLGSGNVSPNPMVGCVIVQDGKIIAEGWHKQYGQAHAEVEAANQLTEEQKNNLNTATVYVTLEPCSHYGKTPPCAHLLARLKPGRVVICNTDPNPLVNGQGIKKLREAGIQVTTGIQETAGAWLNRRFFTNVKEQRAYVILKWAQTADGFVAREDFSSKWISHARSRRLVHRWRSEEDAIMVGSQTVLHDNPSLTVRDWTGNHPTRVIFSRKPKFPTDRHIFDGSVKTIIYHTEELDKPIEAQAETVRLSGKSTFEEMLKHLYSVKIGSIFIEGGSTLINMFITHDLWDEARIFTNPNNFFEKGVKAPILQSSYQIKYGTLGNNFIEWQSRHGG